MFNMSILPLINSSFQPGEAQNIVSNFADQDFIIFPGRLRNAAILQKIT